MKKVLFSIIILLFSSISSAQTLKKPTETQRKAMIAAITKATSQTKTLQCRFVQTKTMSFLNDKMTSEGVMYYDAKGKLRWEYTKPYTYTFIINNNKVYIKSGAKSNTIDIRSSRLFQTIARIMMTSLTGKNLTSNEDFSVQLMMQGNDYVALLTPKKKELKKLYKQVKVVFDSQKKTVETIDMTEVNGDKTRIALSQVKINGKIDEKNFTVR